MLLVLVYCRYWYISISITIYNYFYLLRLLEKHNALQLHFSVFFCFSATFFPEYRAIQSKKYFTDQRSANAIELFACCYKRKFFWSILFLNKSQRRGIPQRLLDRCSHLFIPYH